MGKNKETKDRKNCLKSILISSNFITSVSKHEERYVIVLFALLGCFVSALDFNGLQSSLLE